MATMVLGGLWHGASWTFAAWGAWHGAPLVAHHSLPGWDRALTTFWRRNVTFLLVTLGWVLFRSHSFTHASEWFAGLAGLHGLAGPWTADVAPLFGLVAVGIVIVRACPNSLELPLERLGRVPQIGLGLTTAAALLLMNYGSKFLYFQF
jgi:alginate O-acetyltransferase complex protein AlgI